MKKPEDISIDDLRYMAKDSFTMWALTSGAKVDNNDVEFDKHRYLLPLYLDDSRHIVWQKAAQLGATVWMLLRTLWWLEQHQGRKAGLYFPTNDGVQNLSKDRLAPLIDSCPSIKAISPESGKLNLRNIGKSSFYLYHLGGVASKDSVPMDYMSFDEVRLCDPKDIDQALHRMSHSPYKYKVFASTCGLPSIDINARFERGTQHIWRSTCFPKNQRIWVKNKKTNAVVLKSFEELKTCWKQYKAASIDTQRKNIVFRDITHFHENGTQEVVTLRCKDGTQVTCTPDHRFAWASKKKLTTISYVEAQDILGKYRGGRYKRNNLVCATRLQTHRHLDTHTVQDIISEDLHTTYITDCTKNADSMEVFDITVDASTDRNHNFILENGLVVHNCGCPDGVDLARTFPDCVISDDPRRPDEVYLRCPKCKWEIKDPQNGRYVALNESAKFRSYHVSQLVSKFRTTEEIWEEYLTTTNKEEFYNAALGIPFIDAANRGVTPAQLEACINPELKWLKDVPRDQRKGKTVMGVDQGGAYCMAVIADVHPDGKSKRIRHVEVIQQHNPDYFREGGQVSPFVRLHELMKEYNVGLCVLDLMPNYNEALKFAQSFPRKVFLATYSETKDAVQWHDKGPAKATIRNAGPLLKFKYQVTLSRFQSLSFCLGEWADGNVEIPPPDALRQMALSEAQDFKNQLRPESPARRLFSHLPRLIKRWKEIDAETGRGRWEWVYAGGDPHLAHAWNYCNAGLERQRKKVKFSFA